MTNEIQEKRQNSISVGTVINQAIAEINTMAQAKMFDIPENYSYKNAIQQARYLLNKKAESGKNIGKTIMETCTPQSILQSVIEMAQKGLNPDKKQCYFIPYGNTCQLSVSYQGNVALAKRTGADIEEVFGYAVYKDDEFEIKFDVKKGIFQINNYKPNVQKWNKANLIGAFAIIINSNDKIIYTEYMTIEQIRDAWNMGATKGQSPAHKNFPDQMAIKTVKNRAVKSFINTTDDEDLMNYDERSKLYTDEQFSLEKNEKSNKKELPTIELKVIETEEENKNNIVVDEETEEIIESQSNFTAEEQQEMLNKAPF